MDNLVSIIKAYGGPPTNDQVRSRVLDLIQNWASAAEGALQTLHTLRKHTDRFREMDSGFLQKLMSLAACSTAKRLVFLLIYVSQY